MEMEDEEFDDYYEGVGASHDTAIEAPLGAEDERRFDNPEGYRGEAAHVHPSGMHLSNQEYLKAIENLEDGYEGKSLRSTQSLLKSQLQ